MGKKVPAARNRMCRHLTRRQMSWNELRVRVTIVNDPKKLAELGAELQRRKLGLSTTDAVVAPSDLGTAASTSAARACL